MSRLLNSPNSRLRKAFDVGYRKARLVSIVPSGIVGTGRLHPNFSNAALLERFRDEDTIGEFWNLDDNSRRKIWGKPVNFNQLAQARSII
jgi:hypothetical protein